MSNYDFLNTTIPSKKQIREFLNSFPYDEMSAAVFEYSLNLYDEAIGEFFSASNFANTPYEREFAQQLNSLSSASDIVNMMRKPTSPLAKRALMQKLMQVEDDALELIKTKCMTNMQDYFIENAVRFFVNCKENCCEWILENFDDFRSDYLKSMLCIVIGFRGEPSNIPFLIEKAFYFLNFFSDESFEQAPALAVEEIAVRFKLI
ncbi:MAG: hypothetical protein IJB70_02335 [Clostridia bacterium]|nr:hypothetical protein [Clostridia bacterium]